MSNPRGSSVDKGNTLEHHATSDVGRRRACNQDSWSDLPPSSPSQYQQRGWFFLVADGMGAHAAGEKASAIAAERLPPFYQKAAHHSPPLALRRGIEETNAKIHDEGESRPEYRGMGTTCTALVILPRGAILGHVGDSRCYRVHGHLIEQLTFDHSLVWELERERQQSGGEAAPTAPKNIITRSMGPHPSVKVDLEGPYAVAEGDCFILCSDGLSGQVTDEEIGLLTSLLPPKEAGEALVGLTLVRGAPDNVTVIVARAGREEVSSRSAAEQRWPLVETDDSTANRSGVPWPWLAAAFGGLFLALVFGGMYREPPAWIGGGKFIQAALAVAAGGAALVSATALLRLLVSVGSSHRPPEVRELGPNDRLGKGPYRSYDCSPSPELFEGMVASLEVTAEGLSAADRTTVAEHAAKVRLAAAGGDYPGAARALAAGLGVFHRAVEQARRDETFRDGPA